MKKYLFSAFAAMVAFAAVFTSCSKDDDKNDPVVTDPYDHAEVVIDYEFSDALLTYFDVKFSVVNFEGATEQIVISKSGAGSKTFSTKEKKGDLSISYVVTAKANAPITDVAKTFLSKVIYSYSVVNKNGDLEQSKIFVPSAVTNVSYDLLIDSEDALKSLNDIYSTNLTTTFTLVNGSFK